MSSKFNVLFAGGIISIGKGGLREKFQALVWQEPMGFRFFKYNGEIGEAERIVDVTTDREYTIESFKKIAHNRITPDAIAEFLGTKSSEGLLKEDFEKQIATLFPKLRKMDLDPFKENCKHWKKVTA